MKIVVGVKQIDMQLIHSTQPSIHRLFSVIAGKTSRGRHRHGWLSCCSCQGSSVTRMGILDTRKNHLMVSRRRWTLINHKGSLCPEELQRESKQYHRRSVFTSPSDKSERDAAPPPAARATLDIKNKN